MIYICEYDETTDSRILLEAAGCFFHKEEVFEQKNAEQIMKQNGIRWKKLRERILAWLLFEYALENEKPLWINVRDILHDVDCAVQEVNIRKSHVDLLEIRRTKYGKPYSKRYPELSFNLSHCDTACACILSDCPVGIDIERKFPVKDNLKRSVCNPEEQMILERFDQSEQLHFLWSMKEAYVKMNGRGLGYGMKNVNLADLLPVKSGDCRWFSEAILFTVRSADTYTMAACMETTGFSSGERNEQKDHMFMNKSIIIREQELISWYKQRRTEYDTFSS